MCLYVDYDEAPSAYREKVRRARKKHRCCECGAPIPVGELYEYASGIWDKRPNSYRTHLACAGLRKFIVDVVCGGEGGWIFGGLSEACTDGDREHLDYDDQVEGAPVFGPLESILREIRAKYTVSAAGGAP